MESKVHNRTPMTCPICFKIDNVLGTHLRRKCLKHGSDEEIKETLAGAKRSLSNVASKGLAINYSEVAALLCNGKCIQNMIGFLKNRGFFIYNGPAMQSQLERCGIKEDRILQKNIDCLRKEIGTQTELEMAICQPKSFEDPERQPIQAIINDLDTEEDRELQENNQGDKEDLGKGEQEEPEEQEVHEEEEQEEKENGATATVQRNIAWKNPLRRKMTEAGMYKRHSLEKKPISDFASYLSKTLGVVRYKQEVENVARFLYYMDNEKPSLKFIYNIQKTNKYFAKLLDIGNTNQTVFNYMKNLKRFISYLMDATDLSITDKEAYNVASVYLGQLRVFQKRLSKGISKENIAKKEKCFVEDVQKPTDLGSILSIAEPAFKSALNKAENEDGLTENEKLTILNYLECLIVLRKLQRPGVVQNLTVDEWKKRNPHHGTHVGIPVHEHKTAANQLAVLVLTIEEEKWFDIYFNKSDLHF
ncbi:uncharacterized protein LOC130316815 [Hyla sarda]|uniref:uncharacterized protein LOC130316815 n=1 Tax=Hyla sarda TaxID=327740 RepID=UPI0024C260A9|nr:uncharacterized protein LOC130316815 [Hyla sarda]